MISIQQVANEVGVSRSAVSHVLNGREHLIGVETRGRIHEALRRHDYQPNALVQALKTKRTHVVGVVVPGISTSFYPQVVDAMEVQIQSRGYQLLICQAHSRADTLKQQIDLLRQRRVDGLILTPSAGEEMSIVRQIAETGMRMVLLDAQLEDSHIPFVDVDDQAMGQLAAEHLIQQGRRRLVSITGKMQRYKSSAADRHQGFIETARKHTDVISIEVDDNEYRFEAGQEAVHRLIQTNQPFDGLFAMVDTAAWGAIEALRDHGRKVPDDVAVVGCGDLLVGRCCYPKLTTISQQADEMGRRAADMLLDQLEPNSDLRNKQKQVWLEPKLIQRQSTGAK